MAAVECMECDGTGFVPVGDAAAVRRCGCQRRAFAESDLLAAGMPRRYVHCRLDTYVPDGTQQRQALARARAFVEQFPAVDRGILFTGECGTGKTHLAAAILRSLMLEQGVAGRFVDYQDILKRIQATYSRSPDAATEDSVLAAVIEAELLVLDDLGSGHTTPWAQDTIAHVLTMRYNEERVTILTTNLLEIDPDTAPRSDVPDGNILLAERVQARVFSRIHEMCAIVRIDGRDFRKRRSHA